MKSSHTVISLIKEKSQFQKIEVFDEINKLIFSLPMQIRKYIAFGFQRGENLYFALKNPAIIQEYNTYHSPNILHTLYTMKEFFPKISKAKKITFYYPKALEQNTQGKYFKARKNYAIYSEKIEVIYVQSFREQAKGEFLNQATHPKLHKLFEQIRKAILQKCQSSKL